jgi:hypothetical protein
MKRIVLTLLAASALAVSALAAAPLAAVTAATIDGPKTNLDRIAPHDEHLYEETFLGGEMAQVRVKGYGRTALLVEIYDSEGYLVASDTDADGEALLTWYPTWTETHTIVVTNLWGTWQSYFISCN